MAKTSLGTWLRLLPFVVIIAAALWGLWRLLPPSPPEPGTVVPIGSTKTVGGYVACYSEDDLDAMNRFARMHDEQRYNAYIAEGKCIVLKRGLTVTVSGAQGGFGDKARIEYEGKKMWTMKDALEIYR
jgi:hypothetical protein